MTVLQRKLRTAWKYYNPIATYKKVLLYYLNIKTYLYDKYQRKNYKLVPYSEFYKRKTSDVIFVFGSGSSLQDITTEEWERVASHNTLGWRLFVFQEYARADYLILREIVGPIYTYNQSKLIEESQRLMVQLKNNSKFDDSLVIIQEGQVARAGNSLMGYKLAPQHHTYMRYTNRKRQFGSDPSSSFEEGVVHIYSTLTDAVNFAYLGGWKHIVLIGIDLYDSAYFIMQPGQQNPAWVSGNPSPDAPNTTAVSGIVGLMGEWTKWLSDRDVQISVYNPRSLLAEVMPVFTWESIDE